MTVVDDILDDFDLDHITEAFDTADRNALDEAMTAAGHLPTFAHDHTLECVVGTCSTCGATYRKYVNEAAPRVWSCEFQRHLSERRARRNSTKGNDQ